MILNSDNFVDSPFLDYIQVSIPEDNLTLKEYAPINWDETLDYKLHTLMEGETLQGLAAFYYGDSGKWYYIADLNKILNPFDELKSGMILKIPNI